MIHAADTVVIDVFTLPTDLVAKHAFLKNALFAWKRPLRASVAGLEIGERVKFALAPGVWRFGRVVEWEPTEHVGAMVMARVAVDREDDRDPFETRRQRAHLMPVPEVAHAAS